MPSKLLGIFFSIKNLILLLHLIQIEQKVKKIFLMDTWCLEQNYIILKTLVKFLEHNK